MNIESNELVNYLPPEVVQELMLNCIESLAKHKQRQPVKSKKDNLDDAALGKLINEIIKSKQNKPKSSYSGRMSEFGKNKDLSLKKMIS